MANTRSPAFRKQRLADFGVLYDAEDEELVTRYTWRVTYKGYVEASSYFVGEPKTIKLHRLVLNMINADGEVDHINRNKLDNRKCNLRVASSIINANNRDFVDDAQHIRTRFGHHELRITRDGVTLNKCYPTIEEAREARDAFLAAR